MNRQRSIFYTRRDKTLLLSEFALGNTIDNIPVEDILTKEEARDEVEATIVKMMEHEIDLIVEKHFVSSRSDIVDRKQIINDFLNLAKDDFILNAFEKSLDNLKEFEINIDKSLIEPIDILASAIENRNEENIKKILKIIAKKMYELKKEELGTSFIFEVQKVLFFQAMDQLWMEHLDNMNFLKDSVRLQGYAQKDPLVEYKSQAYDVFESLIHKIDSFVIRRLFKIVKVSNEK